MKTNIEMDKIKLRLNEQLNEARLSELRLDTLKRLMECETNKHDWEVFSHGGQLTKIDVLEIACNNCECYMKIDNEDAAFTRVQPIMINFDGWANTLTSFLGGEEE
tara:strand:+ start:569 stop:886 length:318 start_codon:yes stop_codon:yes gene_type:complete